MIGRWPIRIHLAALVAVAVLPLLAIVGYTTWRESSEARRDAEAQTLALARAAALNASRFLRDAEALAGKLAAAPRAALLDPGACPADWTREIARLPALINVATVDLTGRHVCSAPAPIPATARRVTPQRSPWFRDFLSAPRWVVGDVQLGSISSRQVSELAYPLRSDDGRVVGALVLSLDVLRFRDAWVGLPLWPGTAVTLVDGAGTIVARSLGTGHWTGRSVAPSALERVVGLGADTVLRGAGLGGPARIIAAVPIAPTRWMAVAGIPVSEAFADARTDMTSTLVLAGLVLTLAGVLAIATTRAIAEPLRALGALLDAPPDGPAAALPERGPGELREFISAYNTMLGRRQSAERDAEAARQRMHTVASLAPVGIFHVSAEGRALFVNEQMRRITGLTELNTPKDLIQALHPADRDRVTTAWLNAMRRGAPFRAEYRFRRADGSVIWAQGQAVPEHDDAGKVIGMIGTLVDITDQVRTATDLNVAYARVRSLLAQIESAREQERAHIARELHDQLGQLFVALRMDLGSLENTGPLSAAARERIAAMRTVMDRGVQDTRRLSRELRPSVLDDLGLVPALRWLTDDFSQRSGVTCAARLPDQPVVADSDRATAVFRIIQEALTNISRHARARDVQVVLTAERGMLAASVTDDGAGFDQAAVASRISYGLLGMQERAAAFGGRVSVESAPGQGTTVTMEMPATAASARVS